MDAGYDTAAALYLVGTAQPMFGPALAPGYNKTMLTPDEQAVFVNAVARQQLRVPVCLEHAGFAQGEHRPEHRREQELGEIIEAWLDTRLGVMVAVKLPLAHATTQQLRRDLQAKQQYGFSFYTSFERDPATDAVVFKDLTHIGVTREPAWERESMISIWGTDPLAVRRELRTRYLTRDADIVGAAGRATAAGPRGAAYVPAEMVARLAQTETADSYEQEQRALTRLFPSASRSAVRQSSSVEMAAPAEPTSTTTTPPTLATKDIVLDWAARSQQASKNANPFEALQQAKKLRGEMNDLVGSKIKISDAKQYGALDVLDVIGALIVDKESESESWMKVLREGGHMSDETFLATRGALYDTPERPDDALHRTFCEGVMASAAAAHLDQKKRELEWAKRSEATAAELAEAKKHAEASAAVAKDYEALKRQYATLEADAARFKDAADQAEKNMALPKIAAAVAAIQADKADKADATAAAGTPVVKEGVGASRSGGGSGLFTMEKLAQLKALGGKPNSAALEARGVAYQVKTSNPPREDPHYGHLQSQMRLSRANQ